MPFPLRVVSVERSLFEGDVDFMIANGGDGELGVLAHHAPLMTVLKPGPLTIRVTGGEEQLLFVGGGFLEVLPDRVTVLADVAEHAERRIMLHDGRIVEDTGQPRRILPPVGLAMVGRSS